MDDVNWPSLLKECRTPGEDLFEVLAKANLDSSSLKKLAQPPQIGKPYGRIVLHESEAGEVLLVQWAPETFCALHDHGVGSGVICFFEGICDEEYWDFDPETGLKFKDRITRNPGDSCRIEAGALHRVKAQLDGALSLHFYVPSSGGMRVFEAEKNRYHIVTDDCGAWLPDPAQIKETISW